MTINTARYIGRATRLTRRMSGENFVKFSRQFGRGIPTVQMNTLRKNYNLAVDNMMKWATSPKDVEMTIRHEACHIVAASLLGLFTYKVDLVPRMDVRVEEEPLQARILHLSQYGIVHNTYPSLSLASTKSETEEALAKLATVAAIAGLYEEASGFSNRRGVENVGDREIVNHYIEWAELQTGTRPLDSEFLWEVGRAAARRMLETPRFMEMVETVAGVLSKTDGQQAVDGVKKAMECYHLGEGCGAQETRVYSVP